MTAATSRLLIVTGPSGAGRSTAVNVIEDLGFEVIDNLPLSLVPRLIDGPPLERPLALGLDVRNRDFTPDALIDLLDRERPALPTAIRPEMLYLDCTADVLLRRYSETRRRHPVAPSEAPEEGIARELELLAPVRDRADVLIDTSDLTVHDLRDELYRWFDSADGGRLAISLHSFSYKRGVPRGVDVVFDVRFLRNPHWDPALRPKDGRMPEVAAYVAEDPRYAAFFDQLTAMYELLLPAYRDEGKAHLIIAFGCTGGQHRSVALTEAFGAALAARGWQVSKRHRELERRAALAQKGQG